ncbi:MAG: DEAD/DEAH box helicase family protein [Prevotella sp.]|nr:DEAD/DEAH box helicase family protein [Prevotella sp.]
MEQFSNSIVDISYQQTGAATAVNTLGMREMQALAYEHRDKRFLLIKAPPASGKSRALMFIALDKLVNQGIKKVVVAVPEKSIGRSFKNTNLVNGGFFANWEVPPYFNLTDVKNEQDKKGRFKEFFLNSKAKVLVCAHATLRNATKELSDDTFNDTLLAIDEFHHTSADANSNLGDVVRRVMYHSTGHIIAMTGSYFRGDGIPVLRPEDEAKFYPITYNYYQQLNGYKFLKNLILGYHFYHGSYLDHIGEVLDTQKKTIIHIPSVNQRAATGLGKYQETADIMKVIDVIIKKIMDGTIVGYTYNPQLECLEKRIVKNKSTFDTTGMKVLTLNIKKIYFDEIMSGAKKIEYREMKQTTLNKYTYLDETDGKRYLRRYDALRLFVGYNKDRESALVQVTDITYNEGIVEYHLGLILEKID